MFPIQFRCSKLTNTGRSRSTVGLSPLGNIWRQRISLHLSEGAKIGLQFPVSGPWPEHNLSRSCDRITELEEDDGGIVVIVRSYTRFHAPARRGRGDKETASYTYIRAYNGRRGGSVQLKASGCRGRPLWVGLAEIRLNCWLREKISSVATPRCRWRCALPCASLCRRPRSAPLEDTSSRRCGLPSCEIMDGACRLTGLLQPRQQRKSKNNLKRIGNSNLELRE